MITKTGQKLIRILIRFLLLVPPSSGADPFSHVIYEQSHDTTVNFIPVLICSFPVSSLQAGFTLLEAGLTLTTNAADIIAKTLMDICVGLPGFRAISFDLEMRTAIGITRWR